ncbi:MAG: RluA family pseudouridine synthase [Patescibacteria group bacterium]|nr:RluA family pseudouridine synthase [Patescibacteria group bacterium]
MSESKIISEPEVIYESPDFVAVNKPAGLLMHETAVSKKSDIKEKTLAGWAANKYPEILSVGDDPETRPGIVHRLDKETSGVVLIPRNQKYFEYLKSLFQNHTVKKTYLALVKGRVKNESGAIDKPIGLKPGTVKRVVGGRRMKDIKEAITEYRVKSRFEINGKEYTLIEATPLTGRTHQIRVHLTSIGRPVVGDKLYGGEDSFLNPRRQLLHADSIEFPVASGKMLKISADMPEDFKEVVSKLTRVD